MPSPDGTGGAFAVVARFDDPAALVTACRALREAGYQRFDAHTPFPVHGLDRAMGLRPSKLPWIVLAGGVMGGLGAFALQMWSHGFAYPQNISGKPLFAFQAYIPIAFEGTILLAAFGAFLGMWGLNALPRFYHPVLKHKSFPMATDDRFLVSVEAADPRYHPTETRAFLERLGGRDVEEVTP